MRTAFAACFVVFLLAQAAGAQFVPDIHGNDWKPLGFESYSLNYRKGGTEYSYEYLRVWRYEREGWEAVSYEILDNGTHVEVARGWWPKALSPSVLSSGSKDLPNGPKALSPSVLSSGSKDLPNGPKDNSQPKQYALFVKGARWRIGIPGQEPYVYASPYLEDFKTGDQSYARVEISLLTFSSDPVRREWARVERYIKLP